MTQPNMVCSSELVSFLFYWPKLIAWQSFLKLISSLNKKKIFFFSAGPWTNHPEDVSQVGAVNIKYPTSTLAVMQGSFPCVFFSATTFPCSRSAQHFLEEPTCLPVQSWSLDKIADNRALKDSIHEWKLDRITISRLLGTSKASLAGSGL